MDLRPCVDTGARVSYSIAKRTIHASHVGPCIQHRLQPSPRVCRRIESTSGSQAADGYNDIGWTTRCTRFPWSVNSADGFMWRYPFQKDTCAARTVEYLRTRVEDHSTLQPGRPAASPKTRSPKTRTLTFLSGRLKPGGLGHWEEDREGSPGHPLSLPLPPLPNPLPPLSPTESQADHSNRTSRLKRIPKNRNIHPGSFLPGGQSLHLR